MYLRELFQHTHPCKHKKDKKRWRIHNEWKEICKKVSQSLSDVAEKDCVYVKCSGCGLLLCRQDFYHLYVKRSSDGWSFVSFYDDCLDAFSETKEKRKHNGVCSARRHNAWCRRGMCPEKSCRQYPADGESDAWDDFSPGQDARGA